MVTVDKGLKARTKANFETILLPTPIFSPFIHQFLTKTPLLGD
jgi:hypothetical protein